MTIVPLDISNLELFTGYCYVARSDLHPGLLQGTIRKRNLYAGKIETGLKGLLAQDSKGVTGIVEWMPIEVSHLGYEIPGAIYLHCVWVKPECQGKGIGGELIEIVLKECEGKTILTFGYDYPEHMPRTFFEKYGFNVIEKHNDMHLMLRPRSEGMAEEIKSGTRFLMTEAKQEEMKGRKPLFLFHNDFCPYNWLSLKRVLDDVKGRKDVYFRLFNSNFHHYPESCGEGPTLYYDGRLVSWNPCASGYVKRLLSGYSV